MSDMRWNSQAHSQRNRKKDWRKSFKGERERERAREILDARSTGRSTQPARPLQRQYSSSQRLCAGFFLVRSKKNFPQTPRASNFDSSSTDFVNLKRIDDCCWACEREASQTVCLWSAHEARATSVCCNVGWLVSALCPLFFLFFSQLLLNCEKMLENLSPRSAFNFN